jgi:hypothetical protein
MSGNWLATAKGEKRVVVATASSIEEELVITVKKIGTTEHFTGEGDETHLPRGACFQRDPLTWGDVGGPKTAVERGG